MHTLQQTTALRDIDDVRPRSVGDEECINEIREVLRKHGALQRFGVTLLHQHFPVAGDEILVETCDVENRTLTIQPAKQAEIGSGRVMETNWRLDTNTVTSGCTQICTLDPDDHRHIRKSHL